MTIKNFRQGRLYIEDGSTPAPLRRVITFAGANFTYTEGRTRNLARDRGEVKEVTIGDNVPVEWSFEYGFEDEELYRTIRDGVYANEPDSITGLVGGAANLNVPTTYDYEQGSLTIAPTDPVAPGTKLAIGAAPAVAGEFSENLGAADAEQVIRVPQADGFNVFMPPADTDLDLIYDALGLSTLNPALLATGACTGQVNYFRLRLRIFDPCNPPSTLDLAQGVPELDIVIDEAFLDEDTFSEGEEQDTLAVSGRSLRDKVFLFPDPVGFPTP